ncbi:hypothetical protein BDF19DRAFT_425328 [Syncephalis fuscata]|nr:hypothetical protein BDF19DRAFT_425328 [Syncephalis fuscata]
MSPIAEAKTTTTTVVNSKIAKQNVEKPTTMSFMVTATQSPHAFTMAELRNKHSTPDSLYVAFKGRVFDLTEFAADHPGGTELLLAFAGEDITRVLSDPDTHLHSNAAYAMLESYCIGWLVSDEPVAKTKADNINNNNGHLIITGPQRLPTMTMNFLEQYMREVHKPRYLPYSARLFGSSLLEPLSLTPWWVVPIFWLPVIYYLFTWGAAALDQQLAYALFAIGTLLWTLVEYVLHRFVFHADDWVPDHTWALTLHFTVHGIHHFLPMDRMRLVMPPALAIIIAYPLYNLFSVLMPSIPITNAVFSGILFGYVGYDLTHYYLHHGQPMGEHIRIMKSYHLAHHYKDANLGYGITSKIWDRVFSTLLP